jgi:hypothetical protein
VNYNRTPKTDILLRFIAMISAVLLLVSCAEKVAGTPKAADGAASSPTQTASAEFDWIATVLPTADELSRVLGDQETGDGVDPLVGDVTDLRDTVIGSQVTESQCLGVVAPLERRTFEAAPVDAVAYATRPDSTFGAVAFSSIEATRSLFNALVNEWQQCNDKTVVRSDGTGTYEEVITQVTTSDDQVTAMVSLSTSANGMVVPTVRALGIAEDCIVDVEIWTSDPSAPVSATETPAAALVQLMLAKVAVARR